MAGQPEQAREDQFLGALLGMAIGDALGRPVAGLAAAQVRSRFGTVATYQPLEDAAGGPPQGEITAITELVLCMVESMTTNAGMIDPENINARLAFLARGPSRDWMSDAIITGIARGGEGAGLVDADTGPDPELAVAIRGVPVGLLHAVGGYDGDALARDASMAARLTHAGEVPFLLVQTVAEVIVAAARRREILRPELGKGSGDVATAIANVVDLVRGARAFEEGVASAIGLGRNTNELGALAGAISGAQVGASGIPQDLIDGLDARIYLSLAAPWFYRAAVRRAGTVIDLRVVNS